MSADASQLALFDLAQLGPQFFSEQVADARNPNFTATTCKACKPELYRAVVMMLADGGSIRWIARILNMSPNTVSRIAELEAPEVEAQKSRLASRSRHLVSLLLDRIEEMLLDDESDVKLSELAQALKATRESGEVYAGGPTHRIEHVFPAEMQDELAQAYRLARSKAIDAEMVDPVPVTDPAPEIPEHAGDPGQPIRPSLDPVQEPTA